MEPLLTPAETAAILGTSPAVLAQWRSRGSGPTYIKVNALVRYPPADLRAWLDARTQLAQPNARETAS